MQAAIKPFDPGAEVYIPEGCYITELSNSATDQQLSIARVRVLPGVTTEWHRLQGITERYVILSGEGRVEIGQLAADMVKTGDVVIIPPMVRQRITNIGLDDLIFLAICSPRFEHAAYESIEDKY